MSRLLLRTMIATLALAPTAWADDSGFVPLFDGKTTEGWTPVGGKAGNWLAEDGLLVTKGEGGGWLSTNKTYDNFILKLEFRVGAAGNSGVFIRSPRSGDPAYTGMEIQVLDDNDPQYKNLKPFQYTGSVYGVVAAKRGHTKPPGEWNQMEIRAEGPKVTVKLNGTTIVDADLSAHGDAAKEHPGILRKEGYIGLQSHSDPVKYRNIMVKELK
jgi:hypothetical protein